MRKKPPAVRRKKTRSMKSIIIVGVLRNCASTLESDMKILDIAFSSFNKSYYFVESDSTDSTIKLLDQMKRNKLNFDYTSLGALSVTFPNRISRISYCRNKYLDEIRFRENINSIDYIVVVDMDGINSKLSKSGVDTCFKIENWSVCAANQRGPYYDIFALRAVGWNEKNLADNYRRYQKLYRNHAMAFYLSVIKKMLKPRGDGPIEVDSAFGGIAIYKASTLLKISYPHHDNESEIECEHVLLHSEIRRMGERIIINPLFINAGWTKNARRAFIKLIGLAVLGKNYYRIREPGF